MRIGVSVANTGPIKARLETVGLLPGGLVMGDITMIEKAGKDGQPCCTALDAKPFHPVTIDPGDEVMIWFALLVPGHRPDSRCSTDTLETVHVGFRALEVRRTQQLPLPTKIRFKQPCP